MSKTERRFEEDATTLLISLSIAEKTMQVQTEAPRAPDGGWGWTALAASFIAGTILTGYVKGIGVLLVEWQLYFDVGAREVAWIGMATGCIYKTAGVIASSLSVRFGSRAVVVAGGITLSVSLLVSSFTTNIWHLYVTNIFSGIGISLGYTPSLTVIGYYFHKRLGFANGVAFSGSGLGLIVMPPLMQLLLDKYDWRSTMHIIGGLSLVVCLCGLLMRPTEREKFWMVKQTRQRKRSMRESLSVQEANSPPGCVPQTLTRSQSVSAKAQSNRITKCLFSLIKTGGFHLICENTALIYLCFAFMWAAFGSYSSTVFFNAKAVFDVGISPLQASYLVSAIGVGDLTGRMTHGIFLDRKWISPTSMYILFSFIAAAANLTNPFANSFVTLLVCALIFGASNGPITSLQLMVLRGILPPGDVSVGFGVLLFFNGFSLIAGVFIMSILFDATGNYDLSFVVAGASFLFSGVLILVHKIYNLKLCKAISEDVESSDVTRNGDVKPRDDIPGPAVENNNIFVISDNSAQ